MTRAPDQTESAEDPFGKPNTPDVVIVDVDVNDAVSAVGTDELRSNGSTVAISDPISSSKDDEPFAKT